MDKCSDDAIPTNVSHYCPASKSTLLQQRIMSIDPPDIMFIEFFCEKYPLAMDEDIMVIPACLHWVWIEHLMRNWKKKLGPNVCILTTM